MTRQTYPLITGLPVGYNMDGNRQNGYSIGQFNNNFYMICLWQKMKFN